MNVKPAESDMPSTCPAPTLPLGDASPVSPAENTCGPHRGERQIGDTRQKGSTVVDTYPDVLKHFHSVLHKTVGGTLSCRETTTADIGGYRV